MKIFKDKIKLIVYDFDGVMTDNKAFIDQDGNEMVQVNRSDGLGISEIRKLRLEQVIISSEKNPVVSARAKKLGIKCLQGVDNKKNVLTDYYSKHKIDPSDICFVGNDINDFDAMSICGLRLCPSDAHNKIKKISTFILNSKGGDGVIRELFDLINDKNFF